MIPPFNPPQPRRSVRAVWSWYAGAVSLIALDQFTKILVRTKLDVHESLPLIGDDLLRLTYVLNPGIAFGLRVPAPAILLVFGWIAAAVLAVYLLILVRRGDDLRWPVMLFLAGAIGNSIDRTLFGQVTDFLDADFPNFIMERWPVFNVADSCVTIGIAWMMFLMLFKRRDAAEPNTHSRSQPSDSDSLPTADSVRAVPDPDVSGPAARAD